MRQDTMDIHATASTPARIWSGIRARLPGVFNLNDGKWGRSDDAKPGEAAPADGSPAQPPSQAPAPSPAPSPAAPPANPRPGGSNQGPPDLEDLWRDWNNKLGGLFGGKSAGNSPPRANNGGNNGGGWGGGSGQNGSGGFNMPSGKAASAGLVVAGLVGVTLWLGSGFYIVEEGHKAVITQFGKFKGAQNGGVVGAGFNWRMPWPIQRHETVRVSQVRSVEVGRNATVNNTGLKDSSMLTQDENIVDVRFVVQYNIKDPAEFLFNTVGPEDAVVKAAESAIREVVGKGTMNVVLNEKREAIAGDIVKSTQAQLDLYKSGIIISSVNIQNVQPPEQVKAAFDDALKAGQDGDRSKNEGQAYANDVVPRAEGRASRLKEESEGYKSTILAQAQGESQRFKSILTEYQKAPQVTRDRMYLDAMQQIYSSTTKIMVDSRSGNNLLSLPLDRLLQLGLNTAAADAPAAVPPPAVVAPAPPAPDVRSRDESRGRARDAR